MGNKSAPLFQVLEELIQKPIKINLILIDFQHSVSPQKRRYPLSSQLPGNVPSCQRQVLMSIRNPQPTAIDEARKTTVIDDDIGHARVAVGHDEVLFGGLAV